MSLTLALLRTDLRTTLGMDDTDLPNTDADRLLNRAFWPIAAQLRFNEKDAETSFTTVAGTMAYDMPADSDAIQRVVLKDADDIAYDPLTKIDDWNMFALRDDETQARPTKYSRRDDQFVLYPVPDAVYTVRIKYLATLSDIQSSGPGIPQEWHEVILWGAVSRGFFNVGDWTRGMQAQAQQAVFLNSLDTQEIRELEDKPMSGMKIMRRSYP